MTSCGTESELDNLSHSKSATHPQQVACNTQQVLQQVARLVVQRSLQLILIPESFSHISACCDICYAQPPLLRLVVDSLDNKSCNQLQAVTCCKFVVNFDFCGIQLRNLLWNCGGLSIKNTSCVKSAAVLIRCSLCLCLSAGRCRVASSAVSGGSSRSSSSRPTPPTWPPFSPSSACSRPSSPPRTSPSRLRSSTAWSTPAPPKSSSGRVIVDLINVISHI